MPRPSVVAHRGGAALWPENTLGAFRAVHERFGGRGLWIELDVRLAADGVPVVLHDARLERTTDGMGLVAETPSEEILRCDAAARWEGWEREPVPTLEGVLSEARGAGWRLKIEVKNAPGETGFEAEGARHAEAVVELLDGYPRDAAWVLCFWPPTIDRVKTLDETLRTVLLTTPHRGGLTLAEGARAASSGGHDAVGPDIRTPDLDAETVARVHELGLEVWVWTANTREEIERALVAGVDGITSDHPDLVYEALGR